MMKVYSFIYHSADIIVNLREIFLESFITAVSVNYYYKNSVYKLHIHFQIEKFDELNSHF